MKQEWDMWKKSVHMYRSHVLWWFRHVKRRISMQFRRLGSERRSDRRNIEISTAHPCTYLHDQRDFTEKRLLSNI
jgi:hypothetical protein